MAKVIFAFESGLFTEEQIRDILRDMNVKTGEFLKIPENSLEELKLMESRVRELYEVATVDGNNQMASYLSSCISNLAWSRRFAR